MENEYWHLKNPGYAAMQILYQVKGYLEAHRDRGEETINPQELLNLIDRELTDKIASLDERFPTKKEVEL